MFNMSIGRLLEFSLLFAWWIFYNYTVDTVAENAWRVNRQP